jgi:dsDNA-specific endonuclease/ATPase MutS2
MDKTRGLFILVALLGGAAAGCNRTPADEQKQAVEAQTEANREIQEANRQAAEQTAEVRKDVNEKTAEIRKDYDKTVAEGNEKVQEAQQDARETAAAAQAKANEEIRDANRNVVAADDTLRSWGQERIDALNNKIDDARVKAEKAKPQVRAEFEAGIKDVQAKRDALVTEFASTDTRNTAEVDRFKGKIDAEIDRLKDRVDRLEKRL